VTRPRALQVCPNDHPPFLDLCRNHAAALAMAGFDVDVVFFSAPRGTRWDAGTYLGIERGTRAMIEALQKHCAGRSYRLAVMHRYRAYQVVTSACIDAADRVTLAHEFGMFARRRRRWRQWLFARDVAFAGVSQAVVDEMRRVHPSLQRTFVLPNFVDAAEYDRVRLARADARAALGIADADYAIGVVGRLHPEKRPLVALEAFAGAALPPGARLVFVGDGMLRETLVARARALGIEPRVHFTGYVADAARHLAAFDVALVTSGPTEAFGMAVLEAMIAGVPVVCADQAGPRSVLGPDGRYFAGGVAELTGELGRVAALSAGNRDRLCRAQRERAEREFSLPTVVGIYRSLFNTAAARPAGVS
jgi:glycosyltransferase involved in cell wall biosynthesis